jgi:hypothetical protein
MVHEDIPEEAAWYRHLAHDVRVQAQIDVLDIGAAAEMELLAKRYERMAANLERGWPRDS